MEELWCYLYTTAKHPAMDLVTHPNQINTEHLCQLLEILHLNGIDWTDASIWPEEFIDGKWQKLIPIDFFLANIGNGTTGSTKIISAICSGEAAIMRQDK